MTERFEDSADQVEFRIVVDAERAAQLAPALAELALEYDATVISDHNEHPGRSVESSPESLDFKTDMATEIYEKDSDKTTWIVTKKDFHNFAAGRKFDGTLVSRAFNTIMREVTYRTCIQSTNGDEYIATGTAVEVPDGDESLQPASISGLRVATIERLEAELARAGNIHGYSSRSKVLLKEFVQELFAPADD